MICALFADERAQVASRPITPKSIIEQRVTAIPVTPRIVTASAPPAVTPASTQTGSTIEQIAAENALPPELVRSVIKVESNYNPHAISPKGARGLMQLIPPTARRFGVSNSFDAVENVQGGARYLRYLLDRYAGNYPLALAAYNAGEGAVSRSGGVPPYRETQNYVVQVWRELQRSKKATAPQVQGAPK